MPARTHSLPPVGRRFLAGLAVASVLLTASITSANAAPTAGAESAAAGSAALPDDMVIGRGDFVFPSFESADVAAINRYGDLVVYGGNGRGGWHLPTRWGTPENIGGGFGTFNLVFSPGDFNGDRGMDFMARSSSGVLYLYGRTAGAGAHFTPRVTYGSGWNAFNALFSTGDFDGNGTSDVLARGKDGKLFLYPGDGTGGWLPRTQIGTGWNSLTAVFGAGDFDGDGWNDVIGRAKNGSLILYSGDGEGSWLGTRTIGRGWQSFTAVFSPGDFTGDGVPDVMARTSNGKLYLYPGTGTGSFKPAKLIGSGWGSLRIVS